MPTSYERYLAAKEGRRGKSLRELRFEPEVQPASTLAGSDAPAQSSYDKYLQAKNDLPSVGPTNWWEKFLLKFATGPDGTIMSGPIGLTINSKEWARRQPNFETSAKRVLGGIVSGMTLGVFEPFAEDPEISEAPSYRAGQFVGIAAPITAAAKAAGAVPVIGKATGVAAGALRSGITGVSVAGVEQAVEVVKGDEFSIRDVLLEGGAFAALDLFLRGGGTILRSIIKSRDVKKVAGEIRGAVEGGQVEKMADDDIAKLAKDIVSGRKSLQESAFTELEKKLVVNARTAPTPASMKPFRQLQYPAVTGSELEVMMRIPIREVPGTMGTIAKGFENPIRMHEGYGTKEIMYHSLRKGENEAVRRIKEFNSEFDSFVRERFRFTKRAASSERIMKFAIVEQPGGKEVLKAQGITTIPSLTKTEQEAYNFMRGGLKRAYGELQTVRTSIGTQPFKEVPNYFTFFRTLEGEMERGVPFMNISISRAARAPKFQAEITPFRFAKKRITDEYGPVELDAFTVYQRYMQSAIRHTEVSPAIAKGRQLLDGEFVNGFRLIEHNPQAYNDLNSWLNFSSGVNVHNLPRSIEVKLGALNRNLSWAVLSFNLRSAAIQPTAIWNATVELGPKWIQEGVRGLLNSKTRRFIMKNSETLTGRQHDIAIQEAMAGTRGAFRQVKLKAARLGILPLQVLDLETAKAVWWAAYQKGQRAFKMSAGNAIKYADDTVVRSQASAARVDLAPIQRSALGKSISLFQTFVINNWGFLTKDVAGLGAKQPFTADATRKVIRYIAGASIINTLFEDVLGTRSPFPAPMKEYRRRIEAGDAEGTALLNAAREVAEVVPVVGGAVRYGSHPAGAIWSLGQDITSEIRRGKISSRTFDVFGRAFGIPGSREIYKQVRRVQREEKKGGRGRSRRRGR